MNRQEVISEGYLAAYLTQELPESDAKEVESFISKDAEIRSEYIDLQKTLELLSFHHSIAPSPVIKRWVMEDPSVMQNANLPQESGSGGAWKLMIAASVIITLLSVIAAFYFWNQWQATDSRLAELTARNIELAESYHIVNEELSDIRQDLAVLVSPEFSRIILNGTDNAPDAVAVIYWNAEQEEVYLNSANLAQLTKDKQYQLWALIDGKPVDAGIFDANDGTFQIMKNVARADAFAVTVENAGGSESPALETMQVYGEI